MVAMAAGEVDAELARRSGAASSGLCRAVEEAPRSSGRSCSRSGAMVARPLYCRELRLSAGERVLADERRHHQIVERLALQRRRGEGREVEHLAGELRGLGVLHPGGGRGHGLLVPPTLLAFALCARASVAACKQRGPAHASAAAGLRRAKPSMTAAVLATKRGLMQGVWRELLGQPLEAGASRAAPRARRKAIGLWLRGREEAQPAPRTDHALASWGKSGRTWLRVMLSRFYQRHGMPEGPCSSSTTCTVSIAHIPIVLFTHGNYLRDFTGADDQGGAPRQEGPAARSRPARRRRLAIFPVEVPHAAVEEAAQRLPAERADMSLFDFVMAPDPASPRSWTISRCSRASPALRSSPSSATRPCARTRRDAGRVLEFLGSPATPADWPRPSTSAASRTCAPRAEHAFLAAGARPGSRRPALVQDPARQGRRLSRHFTGEVAAIDALGGLAASPCRVSATAPRRPPGQRA